jgi:hypothetical protein
MRQSFLTGLGLTLLITGMLGALFGRAGVVPGVVFGLLATGLQLLAVRALRRGLGGNHTEFARGFVIGTALRIGGVLLVLLAVLADQARFAPLPTAFGYLGVVVPLLFLEVRFVR